MNEKDIIEILRQQCEIFERRCIRLEIVVAALVVETTQGRAAAWNRDAAIASDEIVAKIRGKECF